MRLYIANLEYSLSAEQLRACLDEWAEVDNCVIVKDRETGRSRGFRFASLPDEKEALTVIEQLNGHVLNGRPLPINEAQPRFAR